MLRVHNTLFVLLAIATGALLSSGCGDSQESSDAGPVDAGEVECGDACDDFLEIGHIVEHVEDLGR